MEHKTLHGKLVGLRKKATLRKEEFWAVNNVSIEVKKGESVGLIGPNGAGKSTLLKMLTGLIKPDKGRITMKGRIGALIELGTGFNPILTGRENIYINGSVLGLTKKEIDAKFDEIVAFSEIEDFIDTPVQNYSSGMKVRLGFAVAAHLEPDILLIDEVLAVGDVRFKLKCFEHLEKLKQRGTAMVIVTHSLNQLSRVCSRVLVFNKGNRVFDGDLSEGILCYDQIMFSYASGAGYKNYTSGNLRLTAAVKNKQEVLTNRFSTGDTIFIDFIIHAKKAYKNIRLLCVFDSPNMGIVSSVFSDDSDIKFNVNVGETVIRLTIKDCPLRTGFLFSGY